MRVGRCRPALERQSKWRVVAVLAFAAVAPVARAQSVWRLIDNETIVAKKTCIRADDVAVTPTGATAWVRDDYAASVRLANGRLFRAARAQLAVDCAAQRWRVTRVVAYDADGAVVDDEAYDARDGDAHAEHDFSPRTPGSELARGVCTVVQYKRQWAASDAAMRAAP